MPVSKEEAARPVLMAFNKILIGQNVTAVAREAGMTRVKLYRTFTFGGEVDPALALGFILPDLP
jgi:DNA-binding phage protein